MLNKKDLFFLIPKVDDLLQDNVVMKMLSQFPRTTVIESIRESLDDLRKQIKNLDTREIENFYCDNDQLVQAISNRVKQKNRMNLRKVINATGVVLHTNLGRALMSESIKEQIWDIASNYSTLEFNIENGKRGSRYSHVEELIKKITGAEGVLVVNNNAAAVMLVLGTIAKNKEVIVSRGQLVEIGGSFRIPEVMEQSGARLKEVGTTNKTHLKDYERAISEETGALLKVHTSNYKILGFTEETDLKDLVGLGEKYGLPVIEDIGSGTLIDFSKYGFVKEPTVQESIHAGADIVTFSGDKLLGGPQAGIIVGKEQYIDMMKKNPLTRAFRIDKLTLAALEATFRLYLDEHEALSKIPTLRMLTMNLERIEERASKLYQMLADQVNTCSFEKIKGYSQVGGGSMPITEIPTIIVTVKSSKLSVNQLEQMLRNYNIPIITRINEDALIMDVRTLKDEEFSSIVQAIKEITQF